VASASPPRRVSASRPATVIAKIDLEDYPVLREAGAAGGEGAKAIQLAPARARLLLRLPESSASGWYRVSVVDESGRTVATTGARSAGGQRLSASLDLRGVAEKSYRLRLARAGEAPDDYPLSISRSKMLREK